MNRGGRKHLHGGVVPTRIQGIVKSPWLFALLGALSLAAVAAPSRPAFADAACEQACERKHKNDWVAKRQRIWLCKKGCWAADKASAMKEAATGLAKKVYDKSKEVVEKVYDGVKSVAKGVWDEVRGCVADGLGGCAQKIYEKAKELAKDAKEWVDNEIVKPVQKKLTQGKKWVKNTIKQGIRKVVDLGKKVVQWTKNKICKSSPEIGAICKALPEAAKCVSKAKEAGRRLPGAIRDAVSGWISKLFQYGGRAPASSKLQSFKTSLHAAIAECKGWVVKTVNDVTEAFCGRTWNHRLLCKAFREGKKCLESARAMGRAAADGLRSLFNAKKILSLYGGAVGGMKTRLETALKECKKWGAEVGYAAVTLLCKSNRTCAAYVADLKRAGIGLTNIRSRWKDAVRIALRHLIPEGQKVTFELGLKAEVKKKIALKGVVGIEATVEHEKADIYVVEIGSKKGAAAGYGSNSQKAEAAALVGGTFSSGVTLRFDASRPSDLDQLLRFGAGMLIQNVGSRLLMGTGSMILDAIQYVFRLATGRRVIWDEEALASLGVYVGKTCGFCIDGEAAAKLNFKAISGKLEWKRNLCVKADFDKRTRQLTLRFDQKIGGGANLEMGTSVAEKIKKVTSTLARYANFVSKKAAEWFKKKEKTLQNVGVNFTLGGGLALIYSGVAWPTSGASCSLPSILKVVGSKRPAVAQTFSITWKSVSPKAPTITVDYEIPNAGFVDAALIALGARGILWNLLVRLPNASRISWKATSTSAGKKKDKEDGAVTIEASAKRVTSLGSGTCTVADLRTFHFGPCFPRLGPIKPVKPTSVASSGGGHRPIKPSWTPSSFTGPKQGHRPVGIAGIVLGSPALENLALGKTVVASSRWPKTPEARGVVSGQMPRAYAVHTRRERNAWVRIDLGRSHSIARVRVYNRGDGWLDDGLPMAVELSEDGRNFTSVSTRRHRFTQIAPWVVETRGRRARYVQVRALKPNGYVALSQIAVIGIPATAGRARNLALDKRVTASSLHPASPTPGGLVNGVREWSYGVHTKVQPSAWVMIDLGRVHSLTRIRVYNRGDGWFDDALPLLVELSSDGKRFSTVGKRRKRFTLGSPWNLAIRGRPARFVRIRSLKRRGYVALSEIEVFGR